jgi:hypothetical protein
MDAATRCQELTRLLTSLLAVLLALQFVLCAALFSGVTQRGVNVFLGAVWLIWVASLVCNYFLVRCGPVAVRFRASPRFVNRQDYASRLFLHLFVNWSTIAVSIAVAWHFRGTPTGQGVAWMSLAAVVVVWIKFNTLHRRMNRGRNLMMSSAIAATLALACSAVLLS